MIEQRTFRIHELDDLDLLGDKLDEAFDAGWQYVSHLSVGRGVKAIHESDMEPDPVVSLTRARLDSRAALHFRKAADLVDDEGRLSE